MVNSNANMLDGGMDAWLGWDAVYAVIERQRGSERALYPLEG